MKEEKKVLINEILKRQKNQREEFFRTIWENTIYQNSPSGNIESVRSITVNEILDFKKEILKKPLYFYNKENGIIVVNKVRCDLRACKEDKFEIIQKKPKIFRNTLYEVIYFKNAIEQVDLLSKILQIKNKKKHIQVSKKLEMNAMILEKGFEFPEEDELDFLKKKALCDIKNEIDEINRDYLLRARNELESIYFYRKSWRIRINKFIRTRDCDLINIIHKINNY